ncbi:MAG: hypothetical protein JWO25_3305 [Alphaproteobacteria bacterium]|nr:hypothetical protein [Alphaproteobacteria bacterium]
MGTSANSQAMPSEPLTHQQLLDELREVLRSVTVMRGPERSVAVRYMEARSSLLAGPLASHAPPFLLQCVSLFKFHDFISLYAPDPERRMAFVDQSFEPCRRAISAVRRYDVFED